MMDSAGRGSGVSHSLARLESAEIMSKKFSERDRVKRSMQEKKRNDQLLITKKKKKDLEVWRHRAKQSPFRVDLLAENERVEEENRVRLQEEERRQRLIQRQKEKAKTEIILKALSEASDLEALRKEKRAIIQEEKRLKALMDLEKTNAHRKQDLMAAQRAERNRQQAVSDYRREQHQLIRREHEEQMIRLLKEKLNVEDDEM